MQGVVFNAHYLAYCDDAVEHVVRASLDVHFEQLGWDFMLKKAVDRVARARPACGDDLDIDVGVEPLGQHELRRRVRRHGGGAAGVHRHDHLRRRRRRAPREPMPPPGRGAGRPRASRDGRSTAEFYRRDPREVAPDLLNKVLVAGDAAGRIVEVEAYCGADRPGSHAYRGPTRPQRHDVRPARAPVRVLHLRDALVRQRVCGDEGEGVAVLLRALAPLDGLEEMRAARPAARARPRPVQRPGQAVPGARHHRRPRRRRPGDRRPRRRRSSTTARRRPAARPSAPASGITRGADAPVALVRPGQPLRVPATRSPHDVLSERWVPTGGRWRAATGSGRVDRQRHRGARRDPPAGRRRCRHTMPGPGGRRRRAAPRPRRSTSASKPGVARGSRGRVPSSMPSTSGTGAGSGTSVATSSTTSLPPASGVPGGRVGGQHGRPAGSRRSATVPAPAAPHPWAASVGLRLRHRHGRPRRPTVGSCGATARSSSSAAARGTGVAGRAGQGGAP